MEADFSGYATKSNTRCTDGRTITSGAFEHMNGVQVPLVWQHMHDNPGNILGHAVLEHRADGVYAHGYFNDTPQGRQARALVQHKDIKSLSIYANELIEKGKSVLHGKIREVSLVLMGANPGATIDYTRVVHSDGDVQVLDDEAIISFQVDLEHSSKAAPVEDAKPDTSADEGSSDDETVADVLNTLSPKQQDVVNYVVTMAVQEANKSGKTDSTDASHADTTEGNLTHQEGTGTVTNVFEEASKTTDQATGDKIIRHAVSTDAMKGILEDGRKTGSLRTAVDNYMLVHGITNIEALFPAPQFINDGTPQVYSRVMAWVQGVIDATAKSPFSRIKAVVADLTQDEARAKGYIKGNYKKEEWFALTSRSTTPTTIYKRQKIDRNDIVDITSFDIIAWLMAEMRAMLMEEVAVAILVGDGRDVDDPDKVSDPMAAASGEGVRSILNENELYATQVLVNLDDANSDYTEAVEAIMSASEFYRGSGSPTFYGTQRTINKMLLTKDANLRRQYDSLTDLAAAMNVSNIVAVEAMNRFPNLIGIVINLQDYIVGTDIGGEIRDFNFFDIDFNQQKYLLETRLSGAITRPKSALVIQKTAGSNVLVIPQTPSFNTNTGVVTIPNQTGVVYKNSDTSATLTAGAQTALAPQAALNVKAFPATGYYFSVSGTYTVDEWNFTNPATS